MKLIKLFSLIIVGLVITSVTVANQGLDQSLEMNVINGEIARLEKENNLLQVNLASATSLASLEPRLEAAGFIAPSRIVTIAPPASLASR